MSHVIETKLNGYRKLANSKNGNPRYDLDTEAGTYRTKPDIQDAYKISGYLVGKSIKIHVGARDQVFGISVQGEDY